MTIRAGFVTVHVHVPYEYDHMFDVIAATLSESLYDHLVLEGILLYIRYTLCVVCNTLEVAKFQPFAGFCLTYADMSHELLSGAASRSASAAASPT